MGRKFAALLLLGWVVSATAGGVYKWVDENGRVHYGEHPPTASQAQELQLKQDTSQGIGMEQERQQQQERLLRAFDEERAQKETEQQKAKEEKAKRKRYCAQARDNLRTYRDASRLYDLDSQGNRRILSDAEQAATIKKAEEDVRRWCN